MQASEAATKMTCPDRTRHRHHFDWEKRRRGQIALTRLIPKRGHAKLVRWSRQATSVAYAVGALLLLGCIVAVAVWCATSDGQWPDKNLPPKTSTTLPVYAN